MKFMHHVCSLPIRDTSGLPKLPPNASWIRRTLRSLRKWFLLNPRNYKVKKIFRNKSSMLAERKMHASGPHSYVFHPLSFFATIIEVLFCVTWTYCLLCDPMMIYSDNFGDIFIIMQSRVIVVLRLIVIALFFNLGYVDQKTNACILQRKKITYRYLKSYFVFDIFSTLCLLVLAVMTSYNLVHCPPRDIHNNCYGYLYLIRLLCCCIRINNLFETLNSIFAHMSVGKRVRIALIYFIKTFLYLHLFAFLIYFVPYTEYKGNWPTDSWLTQADLKHEEKFYMQYSECLIMSVCFFFGISYMYHIEMLNERICIAVITVFGRLYTLYLLADILNVFGIAGISESMYERQLLSLQQYMRDKDLPPNLRQRMVRYYEFKFQKRYFRENEILFTLSDHLRTELFLYTARKLVQKVEFFKRLPNSTMGCIIAAMRAETFSPKDVIVKIGAEVEDICFISTGTVTLMNRYGLELCHLEDGDEFGSTCMVVKEQLFAVVAVETTEVFAINKDLFLEFLAPHSEAMSVFHRSVKQKLTRYKNLEEDASQDKMNLIVELKKGNILEKRSKKLVVN